MGNPGPRWCSARGHGTGLSAAPASALTDVDPAPLVGVLAAQPESSVFVGKGMVGGQAGQRVPVGLPYSRPGRAGARAQAAR